MPVWRVTFINGQLWIVINPKKILKFDTDERNFLTPVTLPLQQPTYSGNEVNQVPLPLFLRKRLVEELSQEIIRNQCCTDLECFQFDDRIFFVCQEDPVPSRHQESEPSKFSHQIQGI